MRIRVLTTGVVRLKARPRGPRRYLPGGWSDQTLPVHAFALEHAEGICLFDTGQSARAGRPGYFPRWHPFFRLVRFELEPEDEVGAQLDPATVRWVVLSHLHTDHVGGLAAFRQAEVVLSAEEWRSAQGLAGRLRGYLPQHWPERLVPRLVDFSGPPLGPFPGSFDLAGDRSLVLVPTPGHTSGHLSLVVAGRYFLGGDLAHTPEDLRAVAPTVSAWCARDDVRVLLAHDPGASSLVPLGDCD